MAKIENKDEKAITLRSFMKANQGLIKGALAHDLEEKRFMNIAWLQARLNPRIMECTFDSILQCLVAAAQLGLYPDGVSGYAYLIPRKIKGKLTACFQTGYLGLIDLFRRSGLAADRAADARVVRANDLFEYEYGDKQYIRHVPSRDKEPGEVIAFWAMLRYKNDGPQFEVMSHEQAFDFMERYAPRYEGKIVGPWTTEFDAMALKTCLRKTCKLAPGPELRRAVAMEERSDAGLDQQLDDGKTIELPDFEVVGREEDTQEPEPKTVADKLKNKLKKDKQNKGATRAKAAPKKAEGQTRGAEPPPEDTVCKHGNKGMCKECSLEIDKQLASEEELPFRGK